VSAARPRGGIWHKFKGMCVAAGRVYLAPWDSQCMLEYDPATDRATGVSVPGIAEQAFISICAASGKVYLTPWNAAQLVEFDPVNRISRGIEIPLGPKVEGKFHHCCEAGGKVFLCPRKAENEKTLFVYDPASGESHSIVLGPPEFNVMRVGCVGGRLLVAPGNNVTPLLVCTDVPVSSARAEAVLAQYEEEQKKSLIERALPVGRPERIEDWIVPIAQDTLKKHSQKAGIQVRYVLEVFPGFVEADPADGLGFGVESPDCQFRDIAKVLFRNPDGVGCEKMCPRDQKIGCSFVDAVDELHRGEATQFVSWCWQYTLSQVVGALTNWCNQSGRQAEKTWLWMCFFCNNQYRIGSMAGTDELKQAFEASLVSIGQMIIIMDDYFQPMYISRVWCIFEAFISVEQNIEPDVALPDSASIRLKSQLNQENPLRTLRTNFRQINTENAEASMPEDAKAIKALIRESIGFDRVNLAVKHRLLPKVADVVASFTREYLMEDSSEEVDTGLQ